MAYRLPVQMEVQVNRACLLTQPQQKLQLDYKTNITQNPQKIQLYGSLTTKELKKPHSSRWATLLRQRDIAALPNIQKQTQGGCQNEKTKKHDPNERTKQNSRKRTKQNGDKQAIRCRVQNTGYQDAQGTHWVLQQHKKKTQAEMKVILSEIKKNLQGTNSGVDEAENQ